METAELIMYTYNRTEVLRNVLEEYINYKKNVGDWKSKETISGNVSALGIFVRMLSAHLRREALTTDIDDETAIPLILQRWPDDGTSHTHASIYPRIKTFVAWLVANRYETGRVTVLLGRKPTVRVIPTKFLAEDEAVKVLSEVSQYSPRDAHMVWIAFLLARRPAEMARLRVGDYNPKETRDAPYGTYTYTETKAHKGRITVRLTSGQRRAIETWLAEYRRLTGAEKLLNDWYMFPRTKGAGKTVQGERRSRRLYPTEPIANVSLVFTNAYKAAGIYEPKKSGHSARRGGATRLHDALEDAGVIDPLQHIQRVLGHSDRKTTAIYIQKDEGDRKTFEALQLLDDMRTEKPTTPETTPEPEEKDESQSDAQTITRADNVVYARFGQRGA